MALRYPFCRFGSFGSDLVLYQCTQLSTEKNPNLVRSHGVQTISSVSFWSLEILSSSQFGAGKNQCTKEESDAAHKHEQFHFTLVSASLVKKAGSSIDICRSSKRNEVENQLVVKSEYLEFATCFQQAVVLLASGLTNRW